MDDFSFEELKNINRKKLSNSVPLELYRAIRLIGMYQGLPMHGKSTTATIGRKIGESLPVNSINEALKLFESLNIGVPTIVDEKENEVIVQVDDCFCKGLPHKEGHLVCDLEGAILEGAFTKILDKRVRAKETKCNVNGDSCCEYQVKM
ncbi:V4R domain-containing protein [Ferdinandcohnia quinoae]|uniref:4-vinyl reductase n=1 Tax=Fredinandcohnia quinoae TaxID=2918902 RepID=A0AAW5EBF8_9BACI|nr:V4R domain-containing protein [Fredinandcohnia sp. SECRCQ15]MCH1626508.1 4-vinyl reductase [Fredinandcohnia sp. SECRCQ15]